MSDQQHVGTVSVAMVKALKHALRGHPVTYRDTPGTTWNFGFIDVFVPVDAAHELRAYIKGCVDGITSDREMTAVRKAVATTKRKQKRAKPTKGDEQ